MRKVVNFMRSASGLNYHAVGAFAFILLPFISMDLTQDPELMPRMSLISLFVSIIILIFILRKRQLEFSGAIPVFRILLFMMAVMALSMIKSINTGDAFTEWLRLAVHFSFLFCVYIIFKDRFREHNLIGRYAMIAVFIFSFFGIYQAIIGMEKPGRIGYSLANTVWSTLTNKNFFSECLVLFLPFLINGIGTEKKYWKFLFGVSLLFDLAFIIILQSAGAWMAVIVGGIIYSILMLKSGSFGSKQVLSFILIATIGVVVLFVNKDKILIASKINSVKEYLIHPELINTTRVENNNSVFERLMLWRNATEMIADHPVTGVGLNNWKLFNPAYGIGGTQFTNSGMINYEHPHNDYLLILAEQGPVGLLIYLLFLIYIIRSGIVIMRKTGGNEKRFIALLVCGVIAFSIISLVSYPRSRNYQMLLLMIISGLIISFSNESTSRFFKTRSLAIILGISITGVIVFTSRTFAEIHTRNTILAQLEGNFPRMYREADKADSWLSPMDIASTPLSWYKGMSKFYMQDIPGAAAEYEKAIAVSPNHLRVLNDLATCYEKMGKRKEAIGYYRKALEISPYFIEGNLNISAAYYNSGNIDSAYYYINRIKGYQMSMFEEGNYQRFLKAILEKKKS